jgi:hypothetical protein
MTTPDHQVQTASGKAGRQRPAWQRKILAFLKDIGWPLAFLVALAALILGMQGFIAYYDAAERPIRVLDSLYMSLKLFAMEFTLVEMADVEIPTKLQLARWMAPAVTSFTLLRALLAAFRKQAHLFRLALIRNHVIIAGLGKKGLLLAQEFCELDYVVVVIEKEGSNRGLEVCADMGVITLIGDARDHVMLQKAGIKRARHLFAVCRDDGDNAEVAFQARAIIEKNKKSFLTAVIHITDSSLWTLLREQEIGKQSQNKFRLEFFNVPDSGARILLQEYPQFDSKNPQRADPPPHLLIIGLSGLGESLIVHSARDWAPTYEESGRKIRVSVVDPDTERKLAFLTRRYPIINTIMQVTAYNYDFNSPEFNLLDQQGDNESNPITSIYICLDDTALSLSAGLTLLKMVHSDQTQILIRLEEDSGLVNFLNAAEGFSGPKMKLQAFGLITRTCRPGLFDDGTHETLARVVHAAYLKDRNIDTGKPNKQPNVKWDELDDMWKQSNRRQADHIGEKLHAIGCGITPWRDYNADKFTFSAAEIEKMAEMEHERWRQERLNWGWHYDPVRNDDKKHHNLLVPWDQLTEEQKSWNRDTVEKIPFYLSQAGFQIYRIRFESHTK